MIDLNQSINTSLIGLWQNAKKKKQIKISKIEKTHKTTRSTHTNQNIYTQITTEMFHDFSNHVALQFH